jgi:NADH dehydrogenase
VAVASLDDTAIIRTVMDGAHTVVHLAGGMNLPDAAAYEAANVQTTLDVVEAAEEASIARLLFLSYPGASSGAENPFLRAKGLAEEAVASAGVDHLILRSTHVYGPGQRWLEDLRTAAARPLGVPVVGTGSQRVAPVHVRDVAAALLSADDRADPISGTLGLQGPTVVTMDELMDLVAGRVRRKVHVPPGSAPRASRLFGRSLHPALLEILAHDSLADARDSADVLGLSLTPLVHGLSEDAATGV